MNQSNVHFLFHKSWEEFPNEGNIGRHKEKQETQLETGAFRCCDYITILERGVRPGSR